MTKRVGSMLSLVAACSVAVSGCGGSDEDEVRELAHKVGASDPSVCARATKGFLHDLFDGSAAKCREHLPQDGSSNEDLKVDDVSVNGHKATAAASVDGLRAKLQFVKRNDMWMVDKMSVLEESNSGGDESQGQPSPAEEPIIQADLEPGAVVDHYLEAIDQEDEARICGLLSEDFARGLLGSRKDNDPLARCTGANFEWPEAKKNARGLKRGKVTVSGTKAIVQLSSRRRAVLKIENGRWVVDRVVG